jgi:hypothetical protein
MFIAVAIICGLLIAMIFPPEGRTAFVGFGAGWRNAPGAILGLLAGFQSARASLRVGRKKE